MHTPGPWKKGIGLMICDANDQLVCIPVSRPDPDEAEANGDLITAVPDLLEAAENLLEFIKAKYPNDFIEGGKGFTCKYHLKLQTAIAKAKGEA